MHSCSVLSTFTTEGRDELTWSKR